MWPLIFRANRYAERRENSVVIGYSQNDRDPIPDVDMDGVNLFNAENEWSHVSIPTYFFTFE
jgi:hypothetical protein